MTAAGQSPSTLFGGVDQLLRDSQDWWLRDQTQLALGFEQWPLGETDWAASGLGSPVQFTAGGNTSAPQSNGYGAVNGGGGDYAGLNGVNGFGNGGGYGSGIQQYPDEHQWYS
jgi:hypothetical protein